MWHSAILYAGHFTPEGLTPEYAAPEVLYPICAGPLRVPLSTQQKRVDGAAADVWSAGVVMYRLVTGELPFVPPGVLVSGLPSALTNPEDSRQWERMAGIYTAQCVWVGYPALISTCLCRKATLCCTTMS